MEAQISTKWRLLVLVMCMIQLVYTKSTCRNNYQECGGALCCCKNEKAFCINRKLTSIPMLPNKITCLHFVRNDIPHVTNETFKNVSNIQRIYFSSNGVKNIDSNSFAVFRYLKELNMTDNSNIDKGQLAMSLYSIPKTVQTLNLNGNNLNALPDDFFHGLIKKKVKGITLKKNRMTLFNETTFFNIPTLKVLKLSSNWIRNISRLDNGTRYGSRTIEYLDLSFNNFLEYPPWFCDGREESRSLYPRLKSLDLSGNTIIVPVRQAWWCLKKLEKLNLDNNVVQILKNDTFFDLISLKKLQLSRMVKPIHTIYPRAFNNTNLKDLHFDTNGLVFKPTNDIPYDTLFKFTPNLKVLHIGDNNFKNLSNMELVKMLNKLPKLQHLHMEGVHLRSIPETLLNNFKLEKLYLGKNDIQTIDPVAFKHVKTLKVLHLNANNIKIVNDTFPETLLSSLQEINLGGNPFSCSFCDNYNNIWFRDWIDNTKIRIDMWPKHYTCASPPQEIGTLLKDHRPTYEDCKPIDPMLIAYGTIGAFIFIFAVFATAAYRGRWYIQYWKIKFTRYWKRLGPIDSERQSLLEDNTEYDAYVIYHDRDFTFVRDDLSRFMEDEHKYKLFIWDRDVISGSKVDIMVSNIYKSKHVIAVISKHFLKDPWCEFQLDVTMDRQVELKRKYLMLVSLEDLDKQLLNKSWCVLFTKTPTADWFARKNDIRRTVFESQILSNVSCMAAPKNPSRQVSTIYDRSSSSIN